MPKHSAPPFLRRKRTLAAGAVGVTAALGAGLMLFQASAGQTAAPRLPTANMAFD